MTEAHKRRRPFIVASPKAFAALPHWLAEKGANSITHADKRVINVWHSQGRYHTPLGYIVVKHERFFDKTIEVIKSAYDQNARKNEKSSLLHLGKHDQSMPQPEKSEVASLRRPGHQSLQAVAPI